MKITVIGMCFLAMGCTFLFLSLQYSFGSLAKVGPGFFPTVVSLLLVASSFLFFRKRVIDVVNYKPILVVLASIISFAVSLYWFNIYAAVLVLTIVYFWGVRDVR